MDLLTLPKFKFPNYFILLCDGKVLSVIDCFWHILLSEPYIAIKKEIKMANSGEVA